MTNLGNLAPSSGYPSIDVRVLAINNKGQVVFLSEYNSPGSPSGFAAFLWKNGMMTDLGNLGGTFNYALGINTAGTIVGSASTSSGIVHAFIWRNGKMKDLNNFLSPNSGWELTSAVSINNKGQIVGRGTFNGQESSGFLLTPVTVSN